MNVSSEMQSLCDHIISASASRADRLGALRHETDALQRDAREIISGFRDFLDTMARGLRTDLKHDHAARMKSVAGLRAGFQREFRATRTDLADARGIWAAMAKG